jgi:hypothetical protein
MVQLLFRPPRLQVTSACEKTIHNSQFIIDDKNSSFSFLSSIILDFYYDGIHTGQQQKAAGVLWVRGCSKGQSSLKLKLIENR